MGPHASEGAPMGTPNRERQEYGRKIGMFLSQSCFLGLPHVGVPTRSLYKEVRL